MVIVLCIKVISHLGIVLVSVGAVSIFQMASQSVVPYSIRASSHLHPVVKKLFRIAESKRSNLIISADFVDTDSLLKCADGRQMRKSIGQSTTHAFISELGLYIAVFKTHIDIVHDFSDKTVSGLKKLAAKHDFIIFEDQKFVDIGTTVQKQYHGGALRISDWADFVNVSILSGAGVVDALEQVISDGAFPVPQREMFAVASRDDYGG